MHRRYGVLGSRHPTRTAPDAKSKLVLNPHPGYNPRQKSRIRLLFSECSSMAYKVDSVVGSGLGRCGEP